MSTISGLARRDNLMANCISEIIGTDENPDHEGTYIPTEKINTLDMADYFFPLFYASERGSLGLWEKKVGLGHIKRRVEIEGMKRFHTLELLNGRNNIGTSISVPKKDWMALHITLPHLVLIVKNFRRNFSFEVQVLDTKGFLRRFQLATWFNPLSLKKWPFLCQVPLRLEIGWNEVHIDLNEMLMKAYRTKFFEAVRLVVNANCRLRQVFFCSDQVLRGEMPIPSMKIYENMRILTPDFGPLNHPDYTESGPNLSRDVAYIEPVMNPVATRIEKDMRLLHLSRFNKLSKFQLGEPFRSYFRGLLARSKFIGLGNQSEESQGVEAEQSGTEVGQVPESITNASATVTTTTTSEADTIADSKTEEGTKVKSGKAKVVRIATKIESIGEPGHRKQADEKISNVFLPRGLRGSVNLVDLVSLKDLNQNQI